MSKAASADAASPAPEVLTAATTVADEAEPTEQSDTAAAEVDSVADGWADSPAPRTVTSVDIESVAARGTAGRPAAKRVVLPRWQTHKLAAAMIALAAIDASLIIGRADVVRVLPQTASLFETVGLPVNLRNLAFKDLKTTHEQHDGVPILVVEGLIVATGHAVTDVPRLRFAIGAGNGHEIYAWTARPTRTKLAPGETLVFRTRLASPPEQGRSVKVRFFARHDLAAGVL